MKLVPCNKEELGMVYKRTKNFEILEEFARGDSDCVRVMYDHAKATYAANSLRESINRFRMDGIIVVKRKDKVYLVKNF